MGLIICVMQQALYTQGYNLLCTLNGSWVGNQSQYGRFEEEEKLLSLPEIERSILSPSHYTDYAIPARLRREQDVRMLVVFTWIRREFTDCTNSSVGCVAGD
jgi:hypothetical protein